MFPLLLAPVIKGITGMMGGSSKLAEGASKTAMKAAVLSASEDDRVQGNLSDSDDDSGGKKEKSEKKSMFGGLDLGRIKSAIGDSGEMGPMQEVKGGVYKQIFEVNKSMLSSLQRMETTMKLLLEVEYERIKGMVSLDASEKLEKGDTDKKTKPGKPGLLSKASKGAGKVFGGIKGGLGGNIGKLLGLGGLLLLFKNFEEEIKVAVQKSLKFFRDVYLYFTADDFTFKKFKDDFKKKFLPKIQATISNLLQMIFNYVKDALFKRGDAEIVKGNTKRQQSKAGVMGLVGQDSAKEGEVPGTFQKVSNKDISAFLGSARDPGRRTSDVLTEGQQSQANRQFNDYLESLIRISTASKSRIQWKGIDTDMGDKGLLSSFADADSWRFMLGINADPVSILNATPIVDGVHTSFDVLKDINLMQMGGMNTSMSESQRDNIEELLAEKSKATAILSTPNKYTGIAGNMMDSKLADAQISFDSAVAGLNYAGQDFTLTEMNNIGGSAEALIKAEAEKKRIAEESAKDNAKKGGFVNIKKDGDNTFVDAKTSMIVPLSTHDEYMTAAFANIRTT